MADIFEQNALWRDSLEVQQAGIENETGKISSNYLTASRALMSDASQVIVSSSATSTELGYVSGVTSALQAQIDGKVPTSRLISTTAPLTGGGNLTTDRTIAIPASTGSVNGYLTSADWTTFNSKQAAITTGTTAQYFRGDLSLATFANALLDGATHSDTLAGAVVDGDTIIGNATPKWSRLAKGSAGTLFQMGASRPGWSAATWPTAHTSGKIVRSDGTNYVESTPTFPNAGTTGKLLIGDGTNYVESTPTFPNASATAGKVIISDGTNYVASTPTFPNAGGTNKYPITSDGTNFSVAQLDLTAGVTGALPAANGGTGQSSYAVGDLLYASGSTALSKLADVALGQVLISKGVGVAPAYSSQPVLNFSDSGTAPSNTNVALTISNADQTANNYSGITFPNSNQTAPAGTAAAGVWAQHTDHTVGSRDSDLVFIDLVANAQSEAGRFTGHKLTLVNPLEVAQGGTGLASWTQGDIPYFTSGTALSKLAKNTTASRYLSNAGSSNAPSWNQIDLTNGVTSNLPLANGGLNSSITASNGGIFYSTASAGALLAGTATAGLVLQSGASTTPSWADPTALNGAAPTSCVAGTGAGTAGTAILTANGTDGAHEVTVTTGTLPGASATIFTLTYATAATNDSIITITPANGGAAALSGSGSVYVAGTSTTYVMTSGSTPLLGGSSYIWNVHVRKV